MNKSRNAIGQYKRPSRIKRFFKRLLIIACIILAVRYGVPLAKKYNKSTPPPTLQVQTRGALDGIMDEETFKKETLLRARTVANNRARDAETNRHNEALKAIENEAEAIRAEELTLAGKNSSL